MINNKGMTLVEEIVALAIISIASLIMLVGFLLLQMFLLIVLGIKI